MTFKKLIHSILAASVISPVMASTADFTINRIKIVGLERVSRNTVFNYLPIHRGDRMTAAKTAKVIRSLYDTGFFQAVDLAREGQTLVIHVAERATIGSVSLSGNRDIPSDRLKEVLKHMGLVKGKIFQRALLTQFRLQLKQEYNARGKYNATIDAKAVPLTQNRVAIAVKISEGRVARIKAIKIFGNKAFNDETLTSLFLLSPSSMLTYFTKSDQYSSYQLSQSLEALRNYYLDRGYLKFHIDSHKVLLSPDKKSVYINVKVTEGPLYHFSGFNLVGRTIISKEKMSQHVLVKKGDVFSKTAVTTSINALGEALGNIGYGLPAINAEPRVDEAKHQVFISFVIQPGRHIYVRRINFNGNTKTADYVLRQVIKQDEATMISMSNVRESERQLRVLGYLKNVKARTVPVPGTNNQVDLEFDVEEAPTAEASASVGYGTNGPEFNAAFNQHNFMGTGRTVGINFNTSYWGRSYGFNYYDPFYKPNGIGRGFDVYYQTQTPGRFNISSFTSDRYGLAVNYNAVLGNHTSGQLGFGVERYKITSLGANPATQLQAFVNANGTEFSTARITLGWNHNTYDRLPYPTSGLNQQANALIALPLTARSLSYYKLSYRAHAYLPIFSTGFIATAFGNVGFGDTFNRQGLPFYENYYAGGIAQPGQVRGYSSYSLGPLDSRRNSMGANFLANGSLGLVLPAPLSKGNVRTTAFFDFGNVFAVHLPQDRSGTDTNGLRYSAGVAVDWRSPFGPLSFSFAKALRKLPGDQIESFQFSISSGF